MERPFMRGTDTGTLCQIIGFMEKRELALGCRPVCFCCLHHISMDAAPLCALQLVSHQRNRLYAGDAVSTFCRCQKNA